MTLATAPSWRAIAKDAHLFSLCSRLRSFRRGAKCRVLLINGRRVSVERRRRWKEEIRVAARAVISGAKTIPSSNRRRESLEISAARWCSLCRLRPRDVRYPITFLYTPTARTNNFFFSPLSRNVAGGDAPVVANNNDAAESCQRYHAVELTFLFLGAFPSGAKTRGMKTRGEINVSSPLAVKRRCCASISDSISHLPARLLLLGIRCGISSRKEMLRKKKAIKSIALDGHVDRRRPLRARLVRV